MEFSDGNGTAFSLELTPCAGGRSNGRIILTVNNAGNDSYLCAEGFGSSFQTMNGNELSFSSLRSDSYSFRLMNNADPETTTDTYTVFLPEYPDEQNVSVTAVSKAEKIICDGKITVTADKNGAYEISIDGENWRDFSSNTVFDELRQGMYRIEVRDKSTHETVSLLNVPVIHKDIKRSCFIDVPMILQKPELPSGCEVTSLTMLLNYIGYDIDKITLAADYLPKGRYRSSDYNKVFVGNPRSILAYGCTAGVIEETAEKYLSEYDTENKWQVKNISGCTAETLYSAVSEGCPVIVWASIDMKELIPDHVTWTDDETGDTISWYGNEHCLLLTGYDRDKRLVYVNDPLVGSTSYDMKTFETRFEQMNRNAIIII